MTSVTSTRIMSAKLMPLSSSSFHVFFFSSSFSSFLVFLLDGESSDSERGAGLWRSSASDMVGQVSE